MALTYADNFTGANGSAPDAAWTHIHRNFQGGADVDPTIQSNRLQYLRTLGGGSVVASYVSAISLRDSDQMVTFNLNTTIERDYALIARYNGGALATTANLHMGVFNPALGTGWLAITHILDGTETILAQSTDFDGATNGTDYKMRMQVLGDTVRVKMWAAAAAEPSAWTLQVTDDTISVSGFSGIYCFRDNNLNAVFDDYRLRPATANVNDLIVDKLAQRYTTAPKSFADLWKAYCDEFNGGEYLVGDAAKTKYGGSGNLQDRAVAFWTEWNPAVGG